MGSGWSRGLALLGCQSCPGQQGGTAAPSPGTSGAPNAPHTTPLTQPPADVQGDAADPALQTKKPEREGGEKKKKIQPMARQKVQTGPGSEAPEQPAAAGSHSPRVTRRGSDIVEIQNSRWLFSGGFFFALPHFQGNKTRCHLLVAIEISPDSASAEEKARQAHCCRGATSRDRLQTYWEERR